MPLSRLLFVLCNLFISAQVAAERVHIAVASNFSHAMEALVPVFEKQTGHKVLVSYGSSGKIFAQISHGAPYHVFFSADQQKPNKLVANNLAVANSQFTYATGALVLLSVTKDVNDSAIERLKSGQFSKLALANAKVAPYGQAAVEVLTRLSLKKKSRSKWVQGENIAQTYQFVASENAELGFVAASQLALQQDKPYWNWWPVPSHLHQPIKQDAVLLKKGNNNAAAKALISFIKSDKAKQVMASYGYQFDDQHLTSKKEVPSDDI